MTTWTRDLAAELAAHLARVIPAWSYRPNDVYGAGETAIVHKLMPAEPDRAVALTLYPLAADGSTAGQLLGIQARCRGVPNDPHDPDDMADELYDVLHGARDLVLGQVVLPLVWRNSHTSTGADSSGRWETSSNFHAHVDHPSNHALD